MLKERDDFEIMAQILKVCEVASSENQVSQDTGLLIKEAEKHINFLVHKGLLLTRDSGEYHITMKGAHYLQVYALIKELLKD